MTVIISPYSEYYSCCSYTEIPLYSKLRQPQQTQHLSFSWGHHIHFVSLPVSISLAWVLWGYECVWLLSFCMLQFKYCLVTLLYVWWLNGLVFDSFDRNILTCRAIFLHLIMKLTERWNFSRYIMSFLTLIWKCLYDRKSGGALCVWMLEWWKEKAKVIVMVEVYWQPLFYATIKVGF